MHQIKTSIRRIAPADLPTITPIGEATRPMNDQELLNIGIQHLSADLYSCIHQEERDDETLQWATKEGQSLPGAVVSEGFLQERHDKLPADVRAQVMRAQVIRSQPPAASAKDTAVANLAEQSAAIEQFVGAVMNAELTNPLRPLVDLATPQAELAEAQRLAAIPNNGIERELVSMADVTEGDVVEADSLVPHSWAGEPKR